MPRRSAALSFFAIGVVSLFAFATVAPTRAVKRRTATPSISPATTSSTLTPSPQTTTKQRGFKTSSVRAVEIGAQQTPNVVVIPKNWREHAPFSERFVTRPVAGAGRLRIDSATSETHVIDLAATSFTTDSLSSSDGSGGRSFRDPDLSSFDASLVRKPFESSERDFFIVQANDPAGQTALRSWLDSAKIDILGYLPDTAYLVRVTRGGLNQLQKRPEVFWVGFYQPAYRIDPKLDFVIEDDPGHELTMTAIFDAELGGDEATVRGKVKAKGLTVEKSAKRDKDVKVRVHGNAVQARDLATTEGALWVERFVDPELHNDVARTSANLATGRGAQSGPVMDVEDVWARGIRGEGQIASAADTGLSTGVATTLHSDFGQQGSATNPLRVIKGYALGRTTTWSDPESSGGGHGTHTSGSIVGNGFNSGSNPGANSFTTGHAGIAPKAQFVFQSVMDSGGGLGGLPANLKDLFLAPYNDGARVHSNSWGSDANGQYTADSQEVDQFIQSHKDMVITFSAGNSGQDGSQYNGFVCASAGFPKDGIVDQDSMGAPATAKNCITVGAAESYRPAYAYENPVNTCTATNNTWGWFNSCNYSTNPIFSDKLADHADGLAPFSSRGPTDDGRIKPDVVAPGTAIVSTRTNQSQSTSAAAGWGTCGLPAAEKTLYNSEGGTSMANPLTAGAAVLVRQYYVDGWHPNDSSTTNGGPTAGAGFNPSSALVKATLINGAWDMAPGQYGTGTTKEISASWDAGKTLPNNGEGYGRVDLEHSLFAGSGWGDDAARRLEVHDAATGLTTGGSASYSFNVTSSANPLIATLAWSDPYAASGAGTKLVNNLNLVVTSPTGIRYYSNAVDKTSGTEDTLNNVEQVKVTVPATGLWTIAVQAPSVPGNAVAGSNSQPYALVISGVAGAVVPDTQAPTTSITAPSAGAVVSGTTSVTASASDDRGVARVEFYLDGTLQSTDTSSPYAWSWNTTTSANGAHAVSSTAFDAAGTSGSSSPGAVTVHTVVDAQAPTAPANLTGTTPAKRRIDLSWAASTDNVGVTGYRVYRATSASGPFTQIATTTSTTYSNTGLSSRTRYYYYVVAVDAANNVSAQSNTINLTAR